MKTKLICGIYSVYCLANRKRYIGISIDIENRWADHTSRLRAGRHRNQRLQSSWNKYGEESFEFMVIQEVPALLLDVHEIAWIQRYDTMNPRFGFNLNEGGSHATHSNESRAKISATKMGKSPSEETRAKLSAANTGKTHSAESRAKMSASRRCTSPETRAKMSAAHKGKKLSAAHRAKLSAAGSGKTHTPEARAKISAAQKGKTVSAETRAKLSAAGMGRKAQRREAQETA